MAQHDAERPGALRRMAADEVAVRRMVSVSARATRAYGGQAVQAMAMIAFSMPGPRADTNASARMSRGKARNTSVTRMRTVSTQPPR